MGRKSFKDEIQVVKYMTELAGPTFAYIKAMYEAGEKADKKWATEQMIKLYSKAIPQAGDDKDNPIFTQQITGMEIIDDSSAEGPAENPVQDPQPQAA
jgi:hypothetical protein